MKKTRQTAAERQATHEARQAAAMAAFQSRTASVTMWQTPESQAAEERAAAKATGTTRAGDCLCGRPVADHFDARNAKRDCAWATQQTARRIETAGAQLQWRLAAIAQGVMR